MSDYQQQRLQQTWDTLKAEWELRNEKLKQLRLDLAIEAGTAVKFQLEKQMLYEEAKLNNINQQLNAIEAELQLSSETKAFPNSLSQTKVYPNFEALSSNKVVEIFISYSPKDEKILKDLEIYLSTLEGIKIWHENKIMGGQNIEFEIEKNLNLAHIILLLISPTFLSEYNNRSDIKLVKNSKKAIKATVIPVLLTRTIGWERFTFANFKLADLKPLPQKDKFITDRRVWINRNDAFNSIARGLEEVKIRIMETI